jgi:hypothetical protein
MAAASPAAILFACKTALTRIPWPPESMRAGVDPARREARHDLVRSGVPRDLIGQRLVTWVLRKTRLGATAVNDPPAPPTAV